MKIQDLIKRWQEQASDPLAAQEYCIRLSVYDAARIAALAEIYPGRTPAQLITELLHVALNELSEALPYIQGRKVVGEDECGDPIYEDVGPTPRFLALTQDYLQQLDANTPAK
jgi:hypothetical protein